MAILKKEFDTFHTTIKLGKYEENKSLRDKRDLLIDELTEALKDEKVPNTDKKLTFTKFDQGSYAMNTGIKPYDDDYDIDVGIIFDITNDEYDSNKLKKLIYDKLNKQHNRTVEFNTPCITVKYADGYHVDLALYADNDADYHIAWGKEHSKKNKCWYKSEPKKLTKWVKDVSAVSKESEQFRRAVRYLKKWKEKHFDNNGNVAPPSIGLTIQSRNAFHDTSGYREDKELDALINIVIQMKNSFTSTFQLDTMSFKNTVTVNLPVEPYKDVYYKMTLNQLDNYYQKLENLLEALESAQTEESDYQASLILRKIFGDDFPLAEDAKKTETKPVTTTGNNA
ncbi:MAG: nucleotidyltransferase [Gammaproteobacteria bacterium]|nr:nucleotidyltransferase [Gammaproteobacteria bacterium]